MRIRIVNRNTPDHYSHGIQLLDLKEQLLRAGLPTISAVEAGTAQQPELRVNLAAQVIHAQERDIPPGVVGIKYESLPESYRQRSLNARLIFNGLREALSDLQISGASGWSDRRNSELVLRVRVADANPGYRGQEAALSAEDADTSAPADAGYIPDGIDRRPQVEQLIRRRRGQKRFRDELRKRYGDRCVVTNCRALAVLEAAHICPYRGETDNHPENGLLLRSDIHTLFDLDLIGFEPNGLRVELHRDIAEEYGDLAGIELRFASELRPSHQAMIDRYRTFRQRLDSERSGI